MTAPLQGAEMPSPAPRRRRAFWVIGGLIGVVVLAAMAVGALLVVNALDSADEDDPGDHRYAFVEGVCRAIDFTPAFEVMPHSAGPRVEELDLGASSTTSCAFDLSGQSGSGALTTRIATHQDEQAALTSHQEAVSVKQDFWQDQEPVDGFWRAGEAFYSAEHGSAVQLVVTEGNLTMELELFLTGEGDREAQLTALQRLADNVRTALRS